MRFVRRAAAGVEAGLLAGAGIAVFFLIQDAVQLRPLATPTALTTGFFGPVSPADGGAMSQAITYGLLGVKLLGFTALHFLAFALVGVAAAFTLDVASFWKSLWGGVAFVGVTCTGLLYGGAWAVGSPVALDALGIPSVLLANAMAGAILGVGLHLAQTPEPEEPLSDR